MPGPTRTEQAIISAMQRVRDTVSALHVETEESDAKLHALLAVLITKGVLTYEEHAAGVADFKAHMAVERALSPELQALEQALEDAFNRLRDQTTDQGDNDK